MGVVYSDQSDISLAEELHKFVYFLPHNYSITVETDDADISRHVGTALAEAFKKAGVGITKELADAHIGKCRELDFPIVCTLKQDIVLH